MSTHIANVPDFLNFIMTSIIIIGDKMFNCSSIELLACVDIDSPPGIL